MSTWLSNKTIGLDQYGYGALLGEAAFTSARVSNLTSSRGPGLSANNHNPVISVLGRDRR